MNSYQEKIYFFVKCQAILLEYHPKSSYIATKDNIKIILNAFISQIDKYKGRWYYNDHACILWKHIMISDPSDPHAALIENAYKEEPAAWNGVAIDFAAFRRISDCRDFIAANDKPSIEHVLFIRDGRPRIYKKEYLIKKLHQLNF